MTHPLTCATAAPLLAVAALFAGATSALADDSTYGNDIRLGLYSVFYHATADDLQGPFVPAGVNIKADNVETLYVGYVRRLSPHFKAELAIGYPPLTKTEGSGPATLGSVPYNGQVISTARWIAPTALLEYNFFDENAKLRPFIGAGVNYTTFYDRDSTAAGNAASGGPTKLSLTSSIGPAATAGLSYKLGGRWGLNASYSISRVNTHLVADTAGLIRTTSIKFGPQALIVSVGYSF
jgi:outer membrane protein